MFNIANEPDIHVPYLYYYLGQPWKAQKIIQDIILNPTVNYYGTHDKWEKPYIGKVFKTSPDGYMKEMDDDAGTMSSWLVLSTIGLFPVCPGIPYYWISAPLFDSITLNYTTGKKLRIRTIRKSNDDMYIQTVQLNGRKLERSWISYEEIMNGGELTIHLGTAPNGNGEQKTFNLIIYDKNYNKMKNRIISTCICLLSILTSYADTLYDVIIIGGTPGGIMTAISAAREGKKFFCWSEQPILEAYRQMVWEQQT